MGQAIEGSRSQTSWPARASSGPRSRRRRPDPARALGAKRSATARSGGWASNHVLVPAAVDQLQADRGSFLLGDREQVPEADRRIRPRRRMRCRGARGARPARDCVTANSCATIPPKLIPTTRQTVPADELEQTLDVARQVGHRVRPAGERRWDRTRGSPTRARSNSPARYSSIGCASASERPEPLQNRTRGPLPRPLPAELDAVDGAYRHDAPRSGRGTGSAYGARRNGG